MKLGAAMSLSPLYDLLRPRRAGAIIQHPVIANQDRRKHLIKSCPEGLLMHFLHARPKFKWRKMASFSRRQWLLATAKIRGAVPDKPFPTEGDS